MIILKSNSNRYFGNSHGVNIFIPCLSCGSPFISKYIEEEDYHTTYCINCKDIVESGLSITKYNKVKKNRTIYYVSESDNESLYGSYCHYHGDYKCTCHNKHCVICGIWSRKKHERCECFCKVCNYAKDECKCKCIKCNHPKVICKCDKNENCKDSPLL